MAATHQIGTVHPSADALISDENVSVVFVLSRHDSHAALTELALRAGKDVFVEKPLALTEDELERVTRAQHESGRILWVGFNRRYSPAVKQAKSVVGDSGGPLVVNYRVNAGLLPETHWYKDRRQGGRLLGEVCHFIDTVSWIVGNPLKSVVAFGSGVGERLLEENLIIGLQYVDGSTASINYATGGNVRTPKERMEILGRGHTVVIDDFRSVSVDGRRLSLKSAGKGHAENLTAYAEALLGLADASQSMTVSLETTSATLAAAVSLCDGKVHATS